MPPQNQQPNQRDSSNPLPPGLVPLDAPDVPSGAPAAGPSNQLPPGLTPLDAPNRVLPPAGYKPSWWDKISSQFNTGATGSPNATSLWDAAKKEGSQLMGEGPISYVTDKVQDMLDAQKDAVAKYPTNDPRRYEGAIPLVGPALQNITNTSLENSIPEGLARGAGTAVGFRIAAKAPEAVAEAVEGLPEALESSRLKSAQNLYERTVAPGGAAADEQAAMRTSYQRGAPYLADEARLGKAQGGEGGVYRVANRVTNQKLSLWDKNVAPVIDRYANVSDPSVPEIGQKIRADLTELNRTKPGAAPAAERLASVFDQPMTVRQMADTVQELNQDRAVSRYYDMTDQERFAAETNDPALRHRVEAVGMLRDKMFNTVGQAGGEQLGQDFAEARRAYGGLSDMESRLRSAKVPTPVPLGTRLANTARLSVSPGAAREYINKPVDTLFNLNNPNRLATKSFNKLGKTQLSGMPAPQVPPVPANIVVGPQTPPQVLPQTPVGGMPPLGFPAELPDRLWEGSQPPQPTWQAPGVSVPSNAPGPQPTAVELPDVLTTAGRQGMPQGTRGLTDAQMRGLPSFMRENLASPTPRPGSFSPGAAVETGPDRSPLPHPPADEGGASVPTETQPPPTDLTVAPESEPSTQVLPEAIQPDFVDKSVHPWESEARVQKKAEDLQQGDDATIVARSNPDGSYSPVKGHNTPVAAQRTGQPVNIVDAGPMTDGEKAATTAESHFFPKDDRAVPASLAKDAASERASLPEEIKNAPALPAKEGPPANTVQSGTGQGRRNADVLEQLQKTMSDPRFRLLPPETQQRLAASFLKLNESLPEQIGGEPEGEMEWLRRNPPAPTPEMTPAEQARADVGKRNPTVQPQDTQRAEQIRSSRTKAKGRPANQ